MKGRVRGLAEGHLTLTTITDALPARAGKNKAKVTLARKLAVILHGMLVDGTPVVGDKAAMVKG